jgi:hypothetical protein
VDDCGYQLADLRCCGSRGEQEAENGTGERVPYAQAHVAVCEEDDQASDGDKRDCGVYLASLPSVALAWLVRTARLAAIPAGTCTAFAALGLGAVAGGVTAGKEVAHVAHWSSPSLLSLG